MAGNDKRYVWAKCPYFSGLQKDGKGIVCDGPEETDAICVRFETEEEMMAYFKKRCCDKQEWSTFCQVARMLNDEF